MVSTFQNGQSACTKRYVVEKVPTFMSSPNTINFLCSQLSCPSIYYQHTHIIVGSISHTMWHCISFYSSPCMFGNIYICYNSHLSCSFLWLPTQLFMTRHYLNEDYIIDIQEWSQILDQKESCAPLEDLGVNVRYIHLPIHWVTRRRHADTCNTKHVTMCPFYNLHKISLLLTKPFGALSA